MLDKTIPYAEIWMYRSQEVLVPQQNLPEGYHFAFYQEGDELEWATIEMSVSEFENRAQALDYFKQTFVPYSDELKQRMLFVLNSAGEKIGTCTAWWKELPDGTRYPLVHWLAIKPGHQGKGIAKALMTRTLHLLQELETNSPIYLHTQTWSHVAIGLYQKLGFTISDKKIDGSFNSDYKKALTILAGLLDEQNSIMIIF